MKEIIALLLICVFLTGCSTCRRGVEKEPREYPSTEQKYIK